MRIKDSEYATFVTIYIVLVVASFIAPFFGAPGVFILGGTVLSLMVLIGWFLR